MNKKITAGIAIASILIVSIGVISALKTTLGDAATELPGEEGIEKTLNLQEGNGQGGNEANEYGESAADEANEYGEGG